MHDFSDLGSFQGKALNVIIETPKGSRNKYDFDPACGLFAVSAVLPLGAVFPFDFGMVPATRGEDGDPLDALVLMEEPLDALVLMEEPTFTGCLVVSRLIGVIEAEQTERDGQTQRNDRLIAVAVHSHVYREIASLDNLDSFLLAEIEHFFVSYNQVKGKEFRPLGRGEAAHARQLVEEGRAYGEHSA